jgi:hypothetical protein
MNLGALDSAEGLPRVAIGRHVHGAVLGQFHGGGQRQSFAQHRTQVTLHGRRQTLQFAPVHHAQRQGLVAGTQIALQGGAGARPAPAAAEMHQYIR